MTNRKSIREKYRFQKDANNSLVKHITATNTQTAMLCTLLFLTNWSLFILLCAAIDPPFFYKESPYLWNPNDAMFLQFCQFSKRILEITVISTSLTFYLTYLFGIMYFGSIQSMTYILSYKMASRS